MSMGTAMWVVMGVMMGVMIAGMIVAGSRSLWRRFRDRGDDLSGRD